MSTTDNTILSPVRVVADVAATLGVDNYNLGYLCSNAHGKTNKYSKRKPIRDNNPFPDRSGAWWKGQNGHCGFLIRTYDSAAAVYKAAPGDWQYLPPRGGTEYFRLRDFEDYWHMAPALHRGLACPAAVAKGDSCEVRLLPEICPPGAPYNLTFDDIEVDGKKISELYFGVAWLRLEVLEHYQNGVVVAEEIKGVELYGSAVADHAGPYRPVTFTPSSGSVLDNNGSYIEGTSAFDKPVTPNPSHTPKPVTAETGARMLIVPFFADVAGGTGFIYRYYKIPDCEPQTLTITAPGTNPGGGTGSGADYVELSLYIQARMHGTEMGGKMTYTALEVNWKVYYTNRGHTIRTASTTVSNHTLRVGTAAMTDRPVAGAVLDYVDWGANTFTYVEEGTEWYRDQNMLRNARKVQFSINNGTLTSTAYVILPATDDEATD